jgi:acetyltransferase-like isoleucine patch superfamily enzyme
MSVDLAEASGLTSRYKPPKSFYVEVAMRTSVIRSAWYSTRFRGIVLVGRGTRVRVHRTATVRLAPGAMLILGIAHDSRAGAVLRMRPRSTLEIDGRVQVMRAATVTVGYDARLSIGAGAFVNDGASVVCDQEVDIGRDCAISWGARIMDTDVHQLVRGQDEEARHAPVRIGDRCWIGAGAVVLKGVELANDCVVGAGSVVTRSAGPGLLLVGAPAKAGARDVSWRH